MSKTKTTGILAEVMAFLNLGEEGKLGSFYNRLEKNLQRSIQGQKKVVESLQFNLGVEVDKLNDKLEDANQAVQDAWRAISPDDVATNAMQDSFVVTYLSNVERAEKAAVAIEQSIEEVTKNYNTRIEAAETQIELLTARIAKITG
jgi:hypothetical protein